MIVNSSQGGGARTPGWCDVQGMKSRAHAHAPTAADRRHHFGGAGAEASTQTPGASRRAARWRWAHLPARDRGGRRAAAGDPAAGLEAIEPLLDRLDGICLSGGPGPRSRQPTAPTPPGARADRARPRPLRARDRPRGRRAGDADPRDLPGDAGAQRRPRRDAASSTCRRSRRRSPTARGPRGRASHTVGIEPEQPASATTIGSRELDVNSFHHQAIERLGEGLEVTAACPATGRSRRSRIPRGPSWSASSGTPRARHRT